MIISTDRLRDEFSEYDFSKLSNERIKRKLESIENLIVEYTHNHFYNRNVKTMATCEDGYIVGYFRSLNVGDTIEIYDSKENNGIYVIENINGDYLELDKEVYDEKTPFKIIKIEYPYDVIEGCIALLDYDFNKKDDSKRGIARESISRHSISYVQYNNSNTAMGYPIDLLGFLKPYMRWKT